MHVREQVVEAMAQRLKAEIPVLEGRCFRYGAPGWDKRSYPMSIITGMRTKLSDVPGTDGRVQQRDCEIAVEIKCVGYDGEDYVERLSDLAIAAERILAGLESDISIESIDCIGDTGVHDLDKTGGGLIAGCALTFAVRFYTHRGNAAAFATPEN